jgi:hypothetical protein
MAAGGLMLWAINTKPGGYSFGELPEVLVRVIARYIG